MAKLKLINSIYSTCLNHYHAIIIKTKTTVSLVPPDTGPPIKTLSDFRF